MKGFYCIGVAKRNCSFNKHYTGEYLFCYACFRVKNLKTAQGCQIAGGAKKLNGLSQDLLEKISIETTSETKMRVLHIVKNGHVYFSNNIPEWSNEIHLLPCLTMGKLGR